MDEKKDNPGPAITMSQCDLRCGKVELALFGVDGRSGIVKDISDIKNCIGDLSDWHKDEEDKKKSQSKGWWSFTKTIVTGMLIVVFTCIVSHIF